MTTLPSASSLEASFLTGRYKPTVPAVPLDNVFLSQTVNALGLEGSDPLLELLADGFRGDGEGNPLGDALRLITTLGGASTVGRATLVAPHDERRLFFDGLQAGCLAAAGALLRAVPELRDAQPFEVRVGLDAFLNDFSDVLMRLSGLTRFANAVVSNSRRYFWLQEALEQPSRNDSEDPDGRAFTAWAVHHTAWDSYSPEDAIQTFQDTFCGQWESIRQLVMEDLHDAIPECLHDYVDMVAIADDNGRDWYEAIPAFDEDGEPSGFYLFASEERPDCLGR